jgi:hypothetical protein
MKQAIKKTETKVNQVSKLNFDDLKEKLNKVELKEKKRKERLYIYPENFTEKMINEKEGKQFRAKQRNKIKTFANNISLNAKFNKIEELKKEVENFVVYYKERYRINDFTINSISQKDAEKTGDIELMLSVVKKVIAAK